MKILIIIVIAIIVYLLIRYIKQNKQELDMVSKRSNSRHLYSIDDHIWTTEKSDFFDDMSTVLNKWDINYAIEKDVDDKKMMVIIRKPLDPFFAVTCKYDE